MIPIYDERKHPRDRVGRWRDKPPTRMIERHIVPEGMAREDDLRFRTLVKDGPLALVGNARREVALSTGVRVVYDREGFHVSPPGGGARVLTSTLQDAMDVAYRMGRAPARASVPAAVRAEAAWRQVREARASGARERMIEASRRQDAEAYVAARAEWRGLSEWA